MRGIPEFRMQNLISSTLTMKNNAEVIKDMCVASEFVYWRRKLTEPDHRFPSPEAG